MTSGYKTITPTQLANALWLLAKGAIRYASLRVYFACFALVAVREAAKRYRHSRREAPRKLARYRFRELERLTGLAPRAIKRALRQLSAAGLVQYGEGEIVIATEPMDGSGELLERLSCGRSPKRPIPVPRSMLRFLAQNRQAALGKTIVAYLVRGLALSRQGGEISGKGTLKAPWIAETFGVSERAVSYARSKLVALGWIERDTKSFQRKLNRDGAYFVINLDWEFSAKALPITPEQGGPVDNSAEPLVNPGKKVPDFAPPLPEKCIKFAPPYKDKKTSYEVKKYQKAQAAELPGVSKQEAQKNPVLRNIVAEDLRSFGRLVMLYEQAASAGWIEPSEANALNFIAAAVRAREVGHDPARVFVTLVRKRLWHHITQAQEDYARRALARFREESPQYFRVERLAA